MKVATGVFSALTRERLSQVLCALLVACGVLQVGCESARNEAPARGVIPPPVAPSEASRTNSGVIQEGEVLDVYVLNDESFNGRFVVHDGGAIVMRKVGRVNVAGSSAAGAEASIRRALVGQLSDAKVVVARSSESSRGSVSDRKLEIFVSGKVNKPGKLSIPYRGGALPTVLQVVAESGGFLRYAHRRQVHVLRRGEDGKLVKIPADIVAIERGEIPDVSLTGGDIVIVPEKSFGVGP